MIHMRHFHFSLILIATTLFDIYIFSLLLKQRTRLPFSVLLLLPAKWLAEKVERTI
jgi:hypothetical protein